MVRPHWNHLAPVERAERFTGAWDGEWFAEDYREGPGQALIVTPKGEVKPCCGFASDLDQLTIGNIYRDRVRRIIRRARRHPYVGKVFREGLTAIRDEILARDPQALPGATSNHCYFERSRLPGRLGTQGVDELLEPGAGHADDAGDGAQAQPLAEQAADQGAFLFGDRPLLRGDETAAAEAAAEGRCAGRVGSIFRRVQMSKLWFLTGASRGSGLTTMAEALEMYLASKK